MTPLLTRPVRRDDADAIARIYAPHVNESAISFELAAPDAATMRERIESVSARYPWIVGERDGTVLGYAYAGVYRQRAAFRWTVESTVYVDRACFRQGIGRILYSELLEECARRGFVTAIGVIALPNDSSIALHEALGFSHIGTQTGVGFKFGAWHDIGIWQRELAPRETAPAEPSWEPGTPPAARTTG